MNPNKELRKLSRPNLPNINTLTASNKDETNGGARSTKNDGTDIYKFMNDSNSISLREILEKYSFNSEILQSVLAAKSEEDRLRAEEVRHLNELILLERRQLECKSRNTTSQQSPNDVVNQANKIFGEQINDKASKESYNFIPEHNIERSTSIIEKQTTTLSTFGRSNQSVPFHTNTQGITPITPVSQQIANSHIFANSDEEHGSIKQREQSPLSPKQNAFSRQHVLDAVRNKIRSRTSSKQWYAPNSTTHNSNPIRPAHGRVGFLPSLNIASSSKVSQSASHGPKTTLSSMTGRVVDRSGKYHPYLGPFSAPTASFPQTHTFKYPPVTNSIGSTQILSRHDDSQNTLAPIRNNTTDTSVELSDKIVLKHESDS